MLRTLTLLLWCYSAAAAVVAGLSLTGTSEASPVSIGAKLGDNRTPDGRPIHCDLPKSLHMMNAGGSDRAGLCVFTSGEHSAMWHNIEGLYGLQEWCKRRPGGGWPDKLDKVIAEVSAERRCSKPRYIQVESCDLEILKLACRTGRLPCVTYGFSPTNRYGGQRISHMVNILHADDDWFCVLDNNFPGTYEWMSPTEFSRTYCDGRGTGWCVIFLSPGPPPALTPKGPYQ